MVAAMEGQRAPSPADLKVIEVKTKRIRLLTDPEMDVFQINFSRKTDNGIYTQVAGSDAEWHTLIAGAKAVAALCGWRFEVKEIPTQPDRYLDQRQPISVRSE